MSKNKTTVSSQVNKVLTERVEVGGKQAFLNIVQQSSCGIDQFASQFRAEYSHLIAYPYKDGTVNRYVEMFIKANKHRFAV